MQLRYGVPIGLMLLAGLSACSNDATSPNNGGSNPTVAISVSPSSLSLAQGANGSVAITVTRSGGFAGAVTLSAENVPTDVAVAPGPTSVGPSSTSATVSVAVGATVVAGSYDLLFRATGSGVEDATATLSLTVTPGSAGSFTLSLDPTSLSIVQGASATATVTLARTGGFSGAVALTATGMPPGMAAAFDPASATGNSSTLTITVDASVATGTYAVSVLGTGSNVGDQAEVLSVAVTQAVPVNQTWAFCQATGLPVWFAYQDGTGPWMAATGNANKYEFGINSNAGAVAYVIPSGTTYSLSVHYGTAAELTQLGTGLCASGTGTKTVMGSVLNLGATEQASITFGDASAVVLGGQNSFTLQNVLDGAHDLIASRVAIGTGGGSVTYTLNGGVIMRGIDPPNGGAITVDFGGAQSFTPVMHNLTIANLGGDGALVTASYITAGGSAAALYTDASASTQATRQFAGVPASAQQAGDLHELNVSAFDLAGLPTASRTVAKLFGTAADQTLTLGPTLGDVTMSIPANAPYVRPRVQYTVQTEYDRFWSCGWTQSAGGTSRVASLTVSAGYLDGAINFDFTLPDFSNLPGWNNQWGFVTGSTINWEFFGAGWTQLGGYGGVPYVDGATSLTANRGGSILP